MRRAICIFVLLIGANSSYAAGEFPAVLRGKYAKTVEICSQWKSNKIKKETHTIEIEKNTLTQHIFGKKGVQADGGNFELKSVKKKTEFGGTFNTTVTVEGDTQKEVLHLEMKDNKLSWKSGTDTQTDFYVKCNI